MIEEIKEPKKPRKKRRAKRRIVAAKPLSVGITSEADIDRALDDIENTIIKSVKERKEKVVPVAGVREKPTPRPLNMRKVWFMAGAAVALFIGSVIAFLGNDTANPLMIMLGVAGVAGGIFLFKAGLKTSDVRILAVGKRQEKPNSLIISPRTVAFEYVTDPLGQPQKNYSDGEYYYVHFKSADGVLREFELPDDDDTERFYDPRELANVVTMPSNKKYFTWSGTTMQKVSIAVLGIIIAGEIIGLIALGG